jgi:hypothetical protein
MINPQPEDYEDYGEFPPDTRLDLEYDYKKERKKMAAKKSVTDTVDNGSNASVETFLARIAASQERTENAIQAVLTAVQNFRQVDRPASQTATGSKELFTPDVLLKNDWADKVVSKDPPFWKADNKKFDGYTYAGRKFSQCSPDYLEVLAEFNTWKANADKAKPDKGGMMLEDDKVTPKLDKKGNPKYWYERLEMEAKLCRSWASYLRSKPPAPVLPEAEEPIAEDDNPF